MYPIFIKKSLIYFFISALLSIAILLPRSEATLPDRLGIEIKDLIEWDTVSGQSYQLQISTTSGVWSNEGALVQGDGHSVQHEIANLESGVEYRLVKTINSHENPLAIWDDFESSGTPGATVAGENNDIFEFPSGSPDWDGFFNTATSMYPLEFSNGGTITFTAYVPNGGSAHIYFRFERLPYPDVDPHFNIGTDIWQAERDEMPSWPSLNSGYEISGATPTEYSISIPSQGSKTFSSLVYYILENDTPVVLQNVRVTDDSTVAGEEEIVSLTSEMVTEISWPTLNNVEYEIMESSNLVDWSDYGTNVIGNGNMQSITMTMEQASRFIRVVEPEFELFAPSDPSAQQSIIANALSISWNPSTTPSVVGYRVYYGTDANNLNQSIDVANVNSATITGLTPETTYFFAIVAYTSDEETDPNAAQFSATPAQSITLIPLHDATTMIEPETSIDTDKALYTYVSDRGRGRHAREVEIESSPALYDIYLSHYWLSRAYDIEIIDRVGKDEWIGHPLENTITFNSTFQEVITKPEFRAFFGGVGTVAQYNTNMNPKGADAYSVNRANPNHNEYDPNYTWGTFIGHRDADGNPHDYNVDTGKYTYTIKINSKYGREIQPGDLMEFEMGPFGLTESPGGMPGNKKSYYGTAIMYKVGEGLVPWYAYQDSLVKFDYTYELYEETINGTPGSLRKADWFDSNLHPLPYGDLAYLSDSLEIPEHARLGGGTTHHTQYSAEPDHAYKQMAYNLSPTNSQKFMDGRRLHHTDFYNGEHSEPFNPNFSIHANKRGPDFINNGCVDCHTNNGRAIPKSPGSLMTKSIVRVGIDSAATVHPNLGTVLQVQSNSETPEKTAYRAAYTEIHGTYGDGSSYTLRKPNYTFGGDAPEFYSVRSAPQLVGLGLLEAIDESTIVNLSDPNDLNNDGISGRINALNDPETGDIRLGRFGYKASKARLRHHIANALNTDMGVTTTIYPTIDFKNTSSSLEINDSELDLMYRYVALLALMPQRDFDDSDVIQGKQLFTQANCVACHIETIQTSDYHPLTELRSQTIHPYTDLLLHDMGTGLSDNMGEGLASGSEWRTAPLWNIGYTEYVSYDEAYLHDGRAKTLEEAILWHGGEAEASKEVFRTMPASDRAKLITFLKSL